MDYIVGAAIHESSVYSQSGGTCYAHAIADAILSNQIRIFGWKAITHDMLVEMMVTKFGSNGAKTSEDYISIFTKNYKDSSYIVNVTFTLTHQDLEWNM